MVSEARELASGKAFFWLNPYCSGIWSRSTMNKSFNKNEIGLNPYCSGIWSRSCLCLLLLCLCQGLILIVVEYGLGVVSSGKK